MKTLWLILRPRARKVNNLRTLLITAILSSLVLSATVQAGVAIGLTRVIVTGADKSGSVQILNDGLHPALLQLWVDNNIAEMDKPIEQITSRLWLIARYSALTPRPINLSVFIIPEALISCRLTVNLCFGLMCWKCRPKRLQINHHKCGTNRFSLTY